MSVVSRLHPVHAQLARRPMLTLLSAAVLLGLLGMVTLRASIKQDIGELLPGGPGSPREAAKLLGEFGTLNTLLLELEVPGASRDQLAERGKALVKRLEASGHFSRIDTAPSFQEMMSLGEVLLSRRLLLLEKPGDELRRRLEPALLDQSLASLKQQLSSPHAFAMKKALLDDPLGLNPGVLARFAGMAGKVEPHQGQLLSADGQHLLLVATPSRPALDTQASQALLEYLDEEQRRLEPGPRGAAVLRAVGGPRFAAESAAGIQKDVVLTLVTSVIALMALFAVRFHNLRLLLLAHVPLLFGLVGGLAAVALIRGQLHALTLGFGAVMIGIAIDYPVHLYNVASAQPGEPLERMRSAVEKTWSSLWLGYVTTGVAFVAMAFSNFPGLQELAIFAGAGVSLAFAATLILLPPLSARLGPKRWPGVPGWLPLPTPTRPRGRALTWAVTLVALLACALLVRGVRFDGELRNLDAQRPQTQAEFEAVTNRFGLGGSQSLVMVKGATSEEVLAKNDAVAAALEEARSRNQVSVVRTLATFLPSEATQRRRAEGLQGMDLDQARAALSEAARREGFKPVAFEAFWREVETAREGKLAPLRPSDFQNTSLDPLLQRFLRCSGDGCIAVTSLSLSDPAHALAVRQQLPEGAFLLDAGALASDIVAQMPRQLLLLCAVALFFNAVILTFTYRSVRLAVLACLPCAMGLLGTLAVLALFNLPLNLVSACALVLVLGCGVDYGIFVLHEQSGAPARSRVESAGVAFATATTLAGLGTLALASHPALRSLGLAVGLGIAISGVVAVVVLPGLMKRPQTERAT